MANDFFKRFDVALQEQTAAAEGQPPTGTTADTKPNQDTDQANDLNSGSVPRWLIIAAATTAAVIFYYIYQ